MIQMYFRVLLACLLVFMPTLTLASTEYVPRVVDPIRIGVFSDTHFDTNYLWGDQYLDHATATWQDAVGRACEYMQSRGVNAVVACGDISMGGYITVSDEVAAWWVTNVTDRGMQFVPVPGNHDNEFSAIFTQQPDTVMYPNYENPYAELAEKYPSLFVNTGERGYGKLNINRWVKILVCNNNVDTTTYQSLNTGWIQRYANCNPPGKGYLYWNSENSVNEDGWGQDSVDVGRGRYTYTNPDWGGFSTYGSDQWNWVISELESDDSIWKIPAFHNSVFAYLHINNRPNRFGQRWGLIAEMTERNVPLVLEGDTHVLSLTHNIHTEESGHMYARDVVDASDLYAEADSGYSAYGIAEGDSIGAKFLTIRSGLYRGTNENTSAPNKTFPNDAATDVMYYHDSPDTTIDGFNHTMSWFAIISIDGNHGAIEIFNISINGSDELTPVLRYYTGLERH